MAITYTNEKGVLIACIKENKILDEIAIQEIGDELMALLDQCHDKKYLIDFDAVSFMSSSMIGKIVYLDQSCKRNGVELRLCSINKNIMEVFKLMNLDQTLKLFEDRAAGLEGFSESDE